MLEETADVLHLPLLPLRDVVVYPHMVIPLFVGRAPSISSLEKAMEGDKRIVVVSQKEAENDNPEASDLFQVGCVASILQLLRLPDGTVKVLVEGLHRANIISVDLAGDSQSAKVSIVPEVDEADEGRDDALVNVRIRSVLSQFEKLAKLNKKIPQEIISSLSNVSTPGRLSDGVAAHLTSHIQSRQDVLEAFDILDRLELIQELMAQELDIIEVEKKIRSQVNKRVQTNQRKYYLKEKLDAVAAELGEIDDIDADESKRLEKSIKEAKMSAEAEEKALSELEKFKLMAPMSAEATVCRNYLEAMIKVPWVKTSKICTDLAKSEKILEADHYGLKKVKERILEYLAVQKRVKKLKGPILCLVGPPGVGKTSLGQSIADATGREFVRMALGGIRDEAEIRGHRRTYIGAMPGKIIHQLSKVKVRNPLFMLDEVDKMAMDFRGDPASALLEVLDPEQNSAFNDLYLEVDYDLSDVMFIATANSLNIPPALLDRMEVIRLAGYTETEKLHIAKKYLIPRQIKLNGLKKTEVQISDGAVMDIIRCYTREAGVRNLDRELANLCRKVVRQLAQQSKSNKSKRKSITQRSLESYIGVKRYRYGLAEENDQVGQVTGLAWTQVGGELLTIESQVIAGTGKSIYTGCLGDVMQESIQAAMTVVRSRSIMLGVEDKFFQKNDFHVHIPEGATPKDGPSAGIGMCTALVSTITKIPVKADVAMTGEITLRGEVLPIGGLKEKLLAALRGGIKVVIIPDDNRRDLKDMPKEVLQNIQIHPVKSIDEVLKLALVEMPKRLVATKKKSSAVTPAAEQSSFDDDRSSAH